MRRVGDRAARILRMPLVLQFVKFGIVGVSNTLIAFAVYTLLLKVFGVWYVAASGIGFAIGAVNGFLWNRAWTFKGHVGDARSPCRCRWFVVQGCGLLLDLGLVYALVDGAGLDKLVGQALTTLVVTVLTFFVNRAVDIQRGTPRRCWSMRRAIVRPRETRPARPNSLHLFWETRFARYRRSACPTGRRARRPRPRSFSAEHGEQRQPLLQGSSLRAR